jgi:predicted esterase
MQAFDPAIEALVSLMGRSTAQTKGPISAWFLMGFSQGAACAFALAASNLIDEIGRLAGIVAIAGFLPVGDTKNLTGIPVYWGHGRKDELVPIHMARDGVERLRNNGTAVDYCEADVGHKLGSECLKGLNRWYQDLN